MGKPCEIHLHKKVSKVKASFRRFILWCFWPEKWNESSIIRNCITVTVYSQLVWKIKIILRLLNNKKLSQLEPKKEKSSETKNYIWDCTKERIIFWERQNCRGRHRWLVARVKVKEGVDCNRWWNHFVSWLWCWLQTLHLSKFIDLYIQKSEF